MQVSNKYSSPSFGAKFFYSKSLKMVADYAVETGRFDKLNEARKNIDNAYLTTRLRVDIAKNECGNPVLMISKFKPKKGVVVPKSFDDYKLVKTSEFVSSRKGDPLAFAYRKILKLANNAPNNNMYKSVVIADI